MAGAGVLFVRFAQTLLLTPALGARALTIEESSVAQPVWQEVATAAGITVINLGSNVDGII